MIEYVYRPVSVIGGAVLTLAGLLAVALIAGVSRHKERLP
jgi:hypothetical protein